MSKYTTTVRTICESSLNMSEPAGFDSVNDILKQSAPLVFNFTFPIWDEKYRLTLETKILKHYYMREIGAETVGLWKLWLDERLNLIMPYYNKLYETTILEFNPLYDVDLLTDHAGTGKKVGANANQEMKSSNKDERRDGANSKSEIGDEIRSGNDNVVAESHDIHSGDSVSRYSDTPQGSITDLAKDKYLTNATIDDDRSKNDNTNKRNETYADDRANKRIDNGRFMEKGNTKDDEISNRLGRETIDTTDKYIQHVVGSNGNRTYAAKILELRQTLINIDAMIIDELKDLFMGIWG